MDVVFSSRLLEPMVPKKGRKVLPKPALTSAGSSSSLGTRGVSGSDIGLSSDIGFGPGLQASFINSRHMVGPECIFPKLSSSVCKSPSTEVTTVIPEAAFVSIDVCLPVTLSHFSGKDKGKRKLLEAWENNPRSKKVRSPEGFSNALYGASPINQSCLSLEDDDDVVLANLKLQRKKVHVKKHKVLTAMQNNLIALPQSAASDVVGNLEDPKWAEAADVSAPSPAP